MTPTPDIETRVQILESWKQIAESGVGLRDWLPDWLLIASALMLVGLLVWVSIIDIREYRIPNWFTLPGIVTLLVAAPLVWENWLMSHWLVGLVTGMLFMLLSLLKGGQAFGAGDAKLYMFAGLLLGPGVVLCVVIASLLGVGHGLVAAWRSGKGVGELHVPHGPHIALGMIATLLVGIW